MMNNEQFPIKIIIIIIKIKLLLKDGFRHKKKINLQFVIKNRLGNIRRLGGNIIFRILIVESFRVIILKIRLVILNKCWSILELRIKINKLKLIAFRRKINFHCLLFNKIESMGKDASLPVFFCSNKKVN